MRRYPSHLIAGLNRFWGTHWTKKAGKNIIFPKSGKLLKYKEIPIDQLRISYLKHYSDQLLFDLDYDYLAVELKTDVNHVKALLEGIHETKK